MIHRFVRQTVPRILVLLILVGSLGRCSGQSPEADPSGSPGDTTAPMAFRESPSEHDARMQWWREARFGMFVHWGLYSGLAGTWEGKPVAKRGGMEWIQQRVKADTDTYAKAAIPKFKPTADFARQWARLAKDAGCKYLVFTTKHHDGFGLFDSDAGDFNAGHVLQRDLAKEIVEACRAEGLKVGFYHSVIDWHHDQYEYALSKQLPHPLKGKPYPNGSRDHTKYQDYLHRQVDELLSNYGPVDVLWWDYSSIDFQGDQAWRSSELIDLVRSKQPNVVMNNRLFRIREAGWAGMGTAGFTPQLDTKYGDFITPEQHIPATGMPGVDWETCMTLNTTWGYSEHDHAWKSDEMLIRNLVDIASKGGNYLLNIGPKGDGSVPKESIGSLQAIGDWMRTNGEAIYATQASPFEKLEWGRCTQKQLEGDTTRLYLHVFDWPENGKLVVPGLANKAINAVMLASNKTLPVTSEEGQVTISLPAKTPDKITTVVVLDIKGTPQIVEPPVPSVVQKRDGTFVLTATQAVLHGELKIEGKYHVKNVGYWLNPADKLEWHIEVSKPGEFTVSAEVASEKSGEVVITVGTETLTAKAPATGDYGNFKTVRLGTLELPMGKQTLQMVGVKKDWHPMNVTKLTLSPVE
ncbi:alpha-L-fucosidase [Aporhodopirellula aestuarii]|uniref:alpha-L-fucosidase n=1 Tax=Aporhodopirellula aestuarii TaxID=2950107 RepID=A0ABT0TY32_9BACT|nr:alpha-L-fucosidase [Aporhodopirellula aestuarii]MCM2369507.1 alpha-L-fucosidase [Aporhodopirellula aestuarii]